MVTVTTRTLRFSSSSEIHQTPLSPIRLAIFLGWASTVLLLLCAYQVMHSNMLAAALLLTMGSSLGYYMATVTVEDAIEKQTHYELFLDDCEVTLLALNTKTQQESSRSLPVGDITLVEYYRLKDAATLVLYCAPSRMEIPIHLFGADAEPWILQYFRDHQISVINLPPKAGKVRSHGR